MGNLHVNLTRFTGGIQQTSLDEGTNITLDGYPVNGGGSYGSGQVTVNGVEVTVRSADPSRRSVSCHVVGNTVWFGPPGVTQANGFIVPAGGAFTFDQASSAVLSATSAAVATVYFIEELAP